MLIFFLFLLLVLAIKIFGFTVLWYLLKAAYIITLPITWPAGFIISFVICFIGSFLESLIDTMTSEYKRIKTAN